MVSFPIYLDNNATTRTDPRVVSVMLPFFSDVYGNAASRSHAFGWAAEEAVDRAREQVAALIGAEAREIVWTSGATESNNLALKGVAQSYRTQGDHIITQATEHKAVLDTAAHLEREGWRVTCLPVDRQGRVDAGAVAAAFTDQTVLVSVMMGNNEIGTLQPVAEIGRLCRERGIVFHCDATQAAGKIPIDVESLQVDLMSFSAHKMYGPKGVGALYVRRKAPRVRLTAQIDGGGHERGRRSGTLNVPGIVGFGAAADLCRQEMKQDLAHTIRLRDQLRRGVLEGLDGTGLNGHPIHCLPNTANLWFGGIDAEALLLKMPDVALSTGSACSSAALGPSHVLAALGLSEAEAASALRFGVSRFTTGEEVDWVVNKIRDLVPALRRISGGQIVAAKTAA